MNRKTLLTLTLLCLGTSVRAQPRSKTRSPQRAGDHFRRKGRVSSMCALTTRAQPSKAIEAKGRGLSKALGDEVSQGQDP